MKVHKIKHNEKLCFLQSIYLQCIKLYSHFVPSFGFIPSEYSILNCFLLPKLKFRARVTFLACVKNTQKLHTFNTIIMCTQKIMRTQQLLNFFALRIAKSRRVIKSWGSNTSPLLVYDRNHYFGLGPIPKPKPKLADTFGRYFWQIP